MRRALAVLIALAIAAQPVAAGRVAIVVDNGGSAREGDQQADMVSSVLERLGGEGRVISANAAKTEFCRTGQFNMAHPAAVAEAVESFVAVVHCNMYYDISNYVDGYRPDSLTLTAKLPTVPQIFIGRHSSGSANSFRTSSAESSGVAFASVGYSGLLDDAYGYSAYLVGSPYRWKWDGMGKAVVDTGTVTSGGVYSFQVVPGGFRPLVALSMTPAADLVCHDCDSLYNQITGAGGSVTRPATEDSLLVWVRQNLHKAGVSQNIFVWPSAVNGNPDPSLIAMALAYADSLTGGQIFTNTKKMPAKAAFHIDDGWRRTANTASAAGGTAPSDTTFLKQTIDSLAALKQFDGRRPTDFPFVVGVGIDSMPQFANQDSTWWERAAPYVHYTPHVHGGTGTVGVGIGGVYDLYSGSHFLYRGDDCADSSVARSIYCLAKLGFDHLERRFRGRVDHVIMPPFDDWTPSYVTKVNAGPGVDSLMWAWNRAGATGTRTNGTGPQSTIMGEIGYQTNPQTYPVMSDGSTAPRIGGFKVHLCAGYMDTGYGTWNAWGNPMANFVKGFFTTAPVAWSTADFQYGQRTIAACHVSDLGGSPLNNVTNRPAWWQIKYCVNRFNAINKLAGRTLTQFVYPDQLIDP